MRLLKSAHAASASTLASRRKEVDRAQTASSSLSSRRLQTRELRHRERPQAPVLGFPALAQLGVLLRAVEQLPVGSVVVERISAHGHQPGAAAFALAFLPSSRSACAARARGSR